MFSPGYVRRLARTSLAFDRESELRETDTVEKCGSTIEIIDASSSVFDDNTIGIRTCRQPRKRTLYCRRSSHGITHDSICSPHQLKTFILVNRFP
jgi:hypothetical protein